MKIAATRTLTHRAVAAVSTVVIAVVLVGCSGDGVSAAERAQAQVTAAQKAVTQAEADLTEASAEFCESSEEYILALDQYGDILNDTAPTVGDVRAAGADLADPSDAALDSAAAAAEAQQALITAQQELVDAQAALARAEAGPSGTPAAPVAEPSSPAPLAPAASVDRVTQAESEFADAQSAITDETPLTDASEQFNSAAVALEAAWLRLFAEAGCLPDDQRQQAQAAVAVYTTALQQDLATAGYYTGAIDGIYGPATVAAVEELQKANGLPVTGTMDNATADALQAELLALGGAAAQESVATTAAVQQTLKLAGLWTGPVDGIWTPELTAAVQTLQLALGVEPTGTVDAATISAVERAIAGLQQPAAPVDPTPTPTATDG
ncbi:peptidoglycan-binding protein [Microbacterium lacus]|uniref:peptidoglycan-binding domain-containing protein n=1 Tax=Microbacterium lacus TaxID=415217 RepID=UPI00384E8D7E